jgi:hypothetical protein
MTLRHTIGLVLLAALFGGSQCIEICFYATGVDGRSCIRGSASGEGNGTRSRSPLRD